MLLEKIPDFVDLSNPKRISKTQEAHPDPSSCFFRLFYDTNKWLLLKLMKVFSKTKLHN